MRLGEYREGGQKGFGSMGLVIEGQSVPGRAYYTDSLDVVKGLADREDRAGVLSLLL